MLIKLGFAASVAIPIVCSISNDSLVIVEEGSVCGFSTLAGDWSKGAVVFVVGACLLLSESWRIFVEGCGKGKAGGNEWLAVDPTFGWLLLAAGA